MAFANDHEDKPREFCGVFGIANHPDAAEMTRLGLYALQHRGQESAGIMVRDEHGCVVEKGMGLVIPGLTPDTLGEIYEYFPSASEIRISVGIFSVGFLLFTLMVKVATPIMLGEFRSEPVSSPTAQTWGLRSS